MAQQKGIFLLQGTIGNISFFKSRDGYLARLKGGASAARIATDPKYQRTRENAAEFAVAAKAGKLLRTAFKSLVRPAADHRMVSRLAGKMVYVLQTDRKNERGMRRVLDGNVGLLEGFEFNEQAKLYAAFSAPYSSNINRVTGELKITILPFVPNSLITAPAGATHFKLVSGGAEVDFENRSSTVDLHATPELPWNNVPTDEYVFNHVVPVNSNHPLFLLLGIEFYQEVNGSMYLLKNGSFNALSIIKVSGTVHQSLSNSYTVSSSIPVYRLNSRTVINSFLSFLNMILI